MIEISILIVDDDRDMRLLLKNYLKNMDYNNIFLKESAAECIDFLRLDKKGEKSEVDLILLDIQLNDQSGIQLLEKIKNDQRYEDIPVIMITAYGSDLCLKNAFELGATDYIRKPVSKIEFLARTSSVLKLREEMKKRKKREKELTELSSKLKKVNKQLEKMASLDGLTSLANRRLFDQTLKKEFQRARRNQNKISLIMADIDNFKKYNGSYGHQAGDECLKKVADVIESFARRPADLAARYGGEEFAVILPDTDREGAAKIAEEIRKKAKSLKIEHKSSDISKYVTLSLGIHTEIPENDNIHHLVEEADKALYRAKESGRDQVRKSKNYLL